MDVRLAVAVWHQASSPRASIDSALHNESTTAGNHHLRSSIKRMPAGRLAVSGGYGAQGAAYGAVDQHVRDTAGPEA